MKRFVLALVAVASMAGITGPAHAQDQAAVLDSIQYAAFRFFWYKANPANGMCPDRSAAGSVSSTASTGFGLSSICVGVDHGWITRAQGRQRVLTTLQTFWNMPQGPGTSGIIGYKGLYYHWLDMTTATRRVDWNSELSTIDTALLFAGIMHARQFFDDPAEADEITIRALADSITRRADWRWVHLGRYLETGTPSDSLGIQMGWNPTTGFSTFGKWTGYNEAMLMYIMAIGSPTHPVPATDWGVWTGSYNFSSYYASVGSYVRFGPLFGHQYSHCWIDFRQIRDAYMQSRNMTYWENSRRATLTQIAFGRQYGQFESTLHFGYSDSLWGWTACDGPPGYGYVARGNPGGPDDGTIAPTAAISSVAFAADSVWPCIRNMWNTRNTIVGGQYRPLWLSYGFTDAFNPEKHPWFDLDVIGIDLGPEVLMIENHLTNAVWYRFMQHPDIQGGLALAGFTPLPTAVDPPLPHIDTELFLAAAPNPFHGSTLIRYRIQQPGRVRVTLFDLQGRMLATLVDGEQAAGEHSVSLAGAGLSPGVYHYRLDTAGASVVRRAVLLK
jgi:hypothetical protein